MSLLLQSCVLTGIGIRALTRRDGPGVLSDSVELRTDPVSGKAAGFASIRRVGAGSESFD